MTCKCLLKLNNHSEDDVSNIIDNIQDTYHTNMHDTGSFLILLNEMCHSKGLISTSKKKEKTKCTAQYLSK